MTNFSIHTSNLQGSGMYEMFRYPAGELQVRLTNPQLLASLQGESRPAIVTIVGSIRSSDDLMELILLGNAVRQFTKIRLVLPYLPYSRADRRFTEADCFGLEALVALLNTIDPEEVVTLDVHSGEAENLGITNRNALPFVQGAICHFATVNDVDQITVLYPDKGARQRYPESLDCMGNLGGVKTSIFHCEKERDPETGKFNGFKVPAELPKQPILIVDDICDGGGTFVGIAEALLHNVVACDHPLGLSVTHGIFSKGLVPLRKYFSRIYTTNSFYQKPWYPTFEDRCVTVYDAIPELLKVSDRA